MVSLINTVLSVVIAVLNVGVSSAETQNANNQSLLQSSLRVTPGEKEWLPGLLDQGCCMELTCGALFAFFWLAYHFTFFCSSALEFYLQYHSSCGDSGFTLERF